MGPTLRPGNSAPFEKFLQRWQTVGNPESDSTGLRFEPQTFRSKYKRFTALPTGRLIFKVSLVKPWFPTFFFRDLKLFSKNQNLHVLAILQKNDTAIPKKKKKGLPGRIGGFSVQKQVKTKNNKKSLERLR